MKGEITLFVEIQGESWLSRGDRWYAKTYR